jgi:hypothetical protein
MLSGFSVIAERAQARGELGENFDVSELTAAIAGPLFYRRWFSRQKLDDAFVRGVVERALGWSKLLNIPVAAARVCFLKLKHILSFWWLYATAP